MKNPFVITLTGVTVALAAVIFWRWAPPLRPHAEASTSGRESEQARDDIEALKREVASLKGMTAARALVTSPAPTEPAPAPAPAPAPSAQKPRKRLTQAEEEAMFAAPLEEAFKAQRPDPSWSSARATEIKGAMVQSLPGTRVLAAECQTTLCRVVVEHDDDESQSSLADKAPTIPSLDVETFLFFDKQSTPPRTTMYLARPGTPLPHPKS